MGRTMFTIFAAMATVLTFAQAPTYQLSSHILEVSKGAPAAGVTIKLEKLNEQTKAWSFVDEKVTDSNGRIGNFLDSKNSNIGIYRLAYMVSDYFKKNNIESFYPFIEVVFSIKDKSHYHVPITLSAYGYSYLPGKLIYKKKRLAIQIAGLFLYGHAGDQLKNYRHYRITHLINYIFCIP